MQPEFLSLSRGICLESQEPEQKLLPRLALHVPVKEGARERPRVVKESERESRDVSSRSSGVFAPLSLSLFADQDGVIVVHQKREKERRR